MAVEARHLHLFRPPALANQGMMMNSEERNGIAFGAPMTYGVMAPLSGITTAPDGALSMYCSPSADNLPAKSAAAVKSENAAVSRKRPRESVNPMLSSSFPNYQSSASFNFLGENITFQIQQQRMEMDRFISQHAEKVRIEMEERQRRFSRRIAAAVKENIISKLRAKEAELEKIGKLNFALEERVKSLAIESQLWRDLAHTNEATANALRSDLEQVLAQVEDEQHNHHPDAAEDDTQSCCGSNSEAAAGVDELLRRDRMCRSCGRDESCVLILPCRHLCVCSACEPSLHACPVCNSIRTASLNVNLS